MPKSEEGKPVSYGEATKPEKGDEPADAGQVSVLIDGAEWLG